MATISKAYIRQLRENSRWRITAELEARLLAEFTEEPYPHVWSDQDLYEQVRRYVGDYNAKFPEPSHLPF